ncbi:MAG: cytochrome c biogenesis heme-transporting ATPase CcmA [Gammaproteobacteria bacterium]|nr:cytochrome c biogenesis heme-transporting ATPase CcmA [Gammaproteobacteria bacterium]
MSSTHDSTATHALEVRGLEIWRGERRLCRDLSFTLSAGELVHIRGANGSGKTSLLRAMAGLLIPDNGEITWNGKKIKATDPALRSQICYLGHANGIKAGLSPRENLSFAIDIAGGASGYTPQTAIERLNIAPQADLLCRFLSAGQKRRTALARVLCSPAKLWLLDEPFTSLDAEGIGLVAMTIGEHLRNGGMIALSSHQEIPSTSARLINVQLGEPL